MTRDNYRIRSIIIRCWVRCTRICFSFLLFSAKQIPYPRASNWNNANRVDYSVQVSIRFVLVFPAKFHHFYPATLTLSFHYFMSRFSLHRVQWISEEISLDIFIRNISLHAAWRSTAARKQDRKLRKAPPAFRFADSSIFRNPAAVLARVIHATRVEFDTDRWGLGSPTLPSCKPSNYAAAVIISGQREMINIKGNRCPQGDAKDRGDSWNSGIMMMMMMMELARRDN